MPCTENEPCSTTCRGCGLRLLFLFIQRFADLRTGGPRLYLDFVVLRILQIKGMVRREGRSALRPRDEPRAFRVDGPAVVSLWLRLAGCIVPVKSHS